MSKKINVVFKSQQLENISLIDISPELQELQVLMPISESDLSVLREDIKENGIRDPLKVCTDKDHNIILLGGMNRLTIAKELNFDTVPVIYGYPENNDLEALNKEQRRDIVWQDNLSRRHLTTNQKTNLIKYLLENNPSASSRSISEILGMSHHTVEKHRPGGQIAQVKRTGADGKKYTNKSKPGGQSAQVNTLPKQNEKPQKKKLSASHEKKIIELQKAFIDINNSDNIKSHLTENEIKALDHIVTKLVNIVYNRDNNGN